MKWRGIYDLIIGLAVVVVVVVVVVESVVEVVDVVVALASVLVAGEVRKGARARDPSAGAPSLAVASWQRTGNLFAQPLEPSKTQTRV